MLNKKLQNNNAKESRADAGKIVIRGARTHNLKNIDVEMPRGKMIAITGPSGSGKSSLAFDTIFAEGQRRYVESLSPYARQFLNKLQKPDVDEISGLSPAISIDQKSASRNPRSTVATITEIYDYLRLLFSRVGRVRCYRCGQRINRQGSGEIVDSLAKHRAADVMILAPLSIKKKADWAKSLQEIKKAHFQRIRLDGKIVDVATIAESTAPQHRVELVVGVIASNNKRQV